jgi:hypothetical protein
MKTSLAIITASISILGLTRAAAAKPKPPAWCATPGVEELTRGNANIDEAVKKEDPAWAMYYLVAASCSHDEEVDDRRGELEAARQYWNQQLDMTDADWADVAVWATAAQGSRYAGLGQLRLDYDATHTRAWSSYDAVEQYLAIAGASSRTDITYLADALGANLSELGRFAFVEQCLEGGTDAREVRWAVCQPDVAAFDPARLAAELRASVKAHDGFQRTIIRLDVRRVRAKLAAHAAEVKALIAGDEAYGKLFALADAARKDWDAHAKERAPLLALMTSMEDARITQSRKAYAGCLDRTWPALTAAIGKLPARTFDKIRDDADHGKTFLDQAIPQIIADPDAYLAALAFVTCRADDTDALATMLGPYVTNTPGFRGPRTATITAIANAAITLDDRNATLRFPFADRSDWYHPSYSSGGGSGRGVVATAKVDGGKLHVTFVKKLVKQTQCAESRETGRVDRIDADGTVRYTYVCVRSETVTVDKAPDPQDVDARYAAGVKPGVYVSLWGDIVQAVWPSATAATPIAVVGIPLR